MPNRTLVTLFCTLLAISGSFSPSAADQAPVTVRTVYFAVHVGPADDQRCVIVGDLYTPADATAASPAPALLTTHGFGGSKNDLAVFAKMYAARGYVTLAYSSLGLGGSTCKATLDDPDYDGKAARALVSYLGGESGIAFSDPAVTRPQPPLGIVTLDGRHDPRIAMVGGSYGGQVQFAAASLDPRIDTIVPMITWNDLSQSIAPNGNDATTVDNNTVPGATKLPWIFGFFANGALAPGIGGYAADQHRADGCPNFEPWLCPAFAHAVTEGFPTADAVRRFRRVSVSSYVDRIRIPVLLIQGEQDMLFDLNEASATFTALREKGTEVSMIWQQWGHGRLTHTPGDYDAQRPDPQSQYIPMRILAWLDHHLRGVPADAGPTFSYFRPWVPYNGIATPAYGASDTFPVGVDTVMRLSGGNALVPDAGAVTPDVQTFSTAGTGLPTSFAPPSMAHLDGVPPIDLPGTRAQWTSAPLAAPLDVVGSPVLRVRLESSSPPLVFAKLEDVAPDGMASSINGMVTPARAEQTDSVLTIDMAAIVHRFEAGHRLRVVLTGADNNFRGSLVPNQVTIRTGDPDQTLTLPTLS